MTRSPWGLPPRVEVSGDVEGPERGTFGLPRLRIHVERRHDDNPYAPHDAWGCEMPTIGALVLPGDVLAYRRLWDSYVMGVVRTLGQCADAWDAIAAGTPAGLPVNPELGAADTNAAQAAKAKAYADLLRADGNTLLFGWNQFAGLSDQDFLLRASAILPAHQKVVLDAGAEAEKCRTYCPTVPLPEIPTSSMQTAVIGQIEGAGILAHGILQLLGVGASGALQFMGDVGHAAKELGDAVLNPWVLALGCAAALALSVAVASRSAPAG